MAKTTARKRSHIRTYDPRNHGRMHEAFRCFDCRTGTSCKTNRMKVSLLTPVRNRMDFMPQAIHDFQWQTYPDLEWVIVDDSDEPLIQSILPDDPRISYYHNPCKVNIGTARNLTCER